MSILAIIGSVFKPAAKLIDSLHTSDAEKRELTNQLTVIQNEFAGRVLDYETKLMESRASIINAESTGKSWLQRNWRPITMLTFLILVVLDSFGLLAFRLATEAWTLLQIGLGGYVVGRSVEKVGPAIVKAIKSKTD